MTKLTPIIQTSNPNVTAEITPVSSEGGIDIFRVNVTFPENTDPSPVTVSWAEEFLNILHIWTPYGNEYSINQWWGARESRAKFTNGAPVLCAIGTGGNNTATVAVSDCETPIAISLGAKNSKRGENLADYKVTFFAEQCSRMASYTADIRIDRRTIPYYESIRSVAPWWEACGYTFPEIPAAAEDALYSTWYSCYQNPIGEDILADLKVAAEAGFKTVILDDGWQFDGPEGGGYSKCGDWQVAKTKFPDFKAFADGVHDLGMKLMVWFTVPFIGVKTEAFKRFEGKYLYKNGEAGIIDPRYPETRNYLKDTYKHYLREYDLDGFKLDFINNFHAGDLTAPFNAEMDCETVEEGTKRLLREITDELAEMKPNLLYEYRQPYISPAINHFGNMLRASDCAYDSLLNRTEITDIRLLGYPTAPHADMLCWSPVEDVKVCAKQLLNILFSVPQISVFLADITEGQKKLLRHYLNYWTSNKDILLHGKFRADNPQYMYTYISAEGEDKLIAAIYNDTPFTYTGKAADVHLNGNRDGLVVENPTENVLSGEIYDCFGELLEKVEIAANAIVRLPVPETGMVHIR